MIKFDELIDKETTNPVERFIIKVNAFKQYMGLWYTVVGRCIVPFILFFIPVNVIFGRINSFIQARIWRDFDWNGTPLLVMWIVIMLGFLALTIFAPKAASVVEFIFGFFYLFLVFRYHLFNSIMGYALLIGMILFLSVKFVFLIFNIIQKITFAKDGEGVERDLIGRKVQAVEEDVYFTEENPNDDDYGEVDGDVYYTEENKDEYEEIAADGDVYFNEGNANDNEYYEETAADGDVYFTDENESEYYEERAVGDEVYFTDENDSDYETPVVEDEVFFTTVEAEDERESPVTDDDFLFEKSEEVEHDTPTTDDDFFFG